MITRNLIDDRGQINQGDVATASSLISWHSCTPIRFKNGTFSPPLTDPNDSQGQTAGADINGSSLVGYYFDLTDLVFHSFLYTEQIFTSLNGIAGATSTTVLSLNSASEYSGQVNDGSGVTQGS